MWSVISPHPQRALPCARCLAKRIAKHHAFDPGYDLRMPLPNYAKKAAFHLLRLGFRLTPMSTATRDRLRLRFLDRHMDLIPDGPRGKMPSAAQTHRPRSLSAGRAIGYRERRTQALPEQLPAKIVAFYLPQFHAIPENDAWWGEGFTEWHNVTRALPQFEGHAQPRLPADLGFYDLRSSDVMRQQTQLARAYGISAFCTYFYWFAGKTLLESPLQRWLDDPSLDLPLCLCWANENWSRRWDGRADQILIAQQHSADDDLAFIQHVSRYMRDARYLRTDGKPILLVYRPALLPEPKATAQRWRQWCRDNGIGDIHLGYVQSFDRVDPRDIGFDFAVAFPPNNTTLTPITAAQRLLNPAFKGDVYDWRELASQSIAQPEPNYPLVPCVNPGWDNEPRRSGAGRVFLHASPRGYRDWLRKAIEIGRKRKGTSSMVFINAWNEWAEGAVLEPDTRLGHAWLDATRQALIEAGEEKVTAPVRPCAIIHVWYVELLDEIVASLRASGIDWRIVITTTQEHADAVRERAAHLALNADIAVFENRGRDILPFLHVADRLLDEGVDVVLKLHTKRSTHREDGERWRTELIGNLLSAERAQRTYQAFHEDSTLGLAAVEGHILPLKAYIGANADQLDYLVTRLGLPEGCVHDARFIAGSMFWVRLAALRPLLDENLGIWEFEDEERQIDGTLAHAVERAMMLVAGAAGFKTTDIASLCGLPAPTSEHPYPYARRSV
jgi:lipopolysaccharide biosynthesis protein